MTIQDEISYRHARAILEQEYPEELHEIVDVVHAVAWVPRPSPRERKREGRVVAVLTIDQKSTNKLFEKEFASRQWQKHPRIVTHAASELAADFRKGPIQVEVQLGNMARWYTDVFKFLLSYSADDIEIGVLMVPMRSISLQIDENVAYFERVSRELPHAKMAITIPIWVIGLGN